MAVTPTSNASVILEGLKNLVANSSTFIAAVEADDYIKAKEHIYLVEVTEKVSRPLAVVMIPGAEIRYTSEKPGIPMYSGLIRLEYETDVDLPHDEMIYSVYNFMDGVTTDISVLMDPRRAVTNDATLRGLEIRNVTDVIRSRTSHNTDLWSTTLAITY